MAILHWKQRFYVIDRNFSANSKKQNKNKTKQTKKTQGVFVSKSKKQNKTKKKQNPRCVCEALMPPKHPSFEKHDPDI